MMKISFRLYKILIFLGGVITFCWLLLIPIDLKNAWLLGYSKSRAIMILLVLLLNLPIAYLLALSFKNKKKYQKITRFVGKRILSKAHIRVTVIISLLAIVVGIFFLLISFGATDQHLRGIFSRLAPLMFLAIISGTITLFFLYYNDLVPTQKLTLIRVQMLETVLLSILLLFFLTISVGSIQNKSYTADEFRHYRYGKNILELDSSRFDDSKMPFSALNAIPKKIIPLIPNKYLNSRLVNPIFTGRIFTIFFSMGIAYFVYRWARSLYGVYAGFFAILLYVLDPNIIAHSRLITTDIYAVGMILLTLYTFWRFCNNKNWKNFFLSAIILGISQLAKYTSAYLYPILLTIALIRIFPAWATSFRKGQYHDIWKDLKSSFKYVLLFLIISLLIINVGFLFNRTFTPLEEYSFRSELFQSAQVKFSKIGFMPVPVPYPYLEGLDWVKERERTGAGYGNIYLFGEVREAEGFNGYYIYASLLKVPIATQIFIISALILYITKRKNFNFIQNEIFLFIPIGFFFIYFNFLFRTQIGIRFYLVLFPFLYILSGALVSKWASMRKSLKIITLALTIYLATSVISAYPNYIQYFNEIIWDRRNAYKYLIDSNLDWNQEEGKLRHYLETLPEAEYQPEQPRYGTIVVSPNELAGMWYEEEFRWLRDNFQPTDTIEDVYLIYEISKDEFEEVFGR